jgi:hypothetical protein
MGVMRQMKMLTFWVDSEIKLLWNWDKNKVTNRIFVNIGENLEKWVNFNESLGIYWINWFLK